MDGTRTKKQVFANPWQINLGSSNLGVLGESLAAAEYESRGFFISQKNFANSYGKRFGEIDLIATKKDLVVFVEVKTRLGLDSFEAAIGAITKVKQHRLVMAAKEYIRQNPSMMNTSLRFDACVVLVDRFDNSQFSVTIIEDVIEAV